MEAAPAVRPLQRFPGGFPGTLAGRVKQTIRKSKTETRSAHGHPRAGLPTTGGKASGQHSARKEIPRCSQERGQRVCPLNALGDLL